MQITYTAAVQCSANQYNQVPQPTSRQWTRLDILRLYKIGVSEIFSDLLFSIQVARMKPPSSPNYTPFGCLRRSERYFNSVPIHCNKLKWWHFRDPTMHPTKTSQPVPWSGLSADPYTIGKCHYPLMKSRWQMCLYTLYIQEVSSSNDHNPQSWQL